MLPKKSKLCESTLMCCGRCRVVALRLGGAQRPEQSAQSKSTETSCRAQFVEKDPKLAEPVLRALLKFWPLTNSQKEVLFIGELEEVLELTQARALSRWVRGEGQGWGDLQPVRLGAAASICRGGLPAIRVVACH